MATIAVKPGVVFKRFTPALVRIVSALDFIASEPEYWQIPGLPTTITITSANDGKHMAGSRHYTDEALDVRSKNFPTPRSKVAFVKALRDHLGPKFTVLHESAGKPNEHVHIQIAKGTTYP